MVLFCAVGVRYCRCIFGLTTPAHYRCLWRVRTRTIAADPPIVRVPQYSGLCLYHEISPALYRTPAGHPHYITRAIQGPLLQIKNNDLCVKLKQTVPPSTLAVSTVVTNKGRPLWAQNFVLRTLIWRSSNKEFQETLIMGRSFLGTWP